MTAESKRKKRTMPAALLKGHTTASLETANFSDGLSARCHTPLGFERHVTAMSLSDF